MVIQIWGFLVSEILFLSKSMITVMVHILMILLMAFEDLNFLGIVLFPFMAEIVTEVKWSQFC